MCVYDPHINFYVRADEVVRENVPPAVPQLLELRRSFDMPSGFTVAQLDDLLSTLEKKLENWLGNNPPESPTEE